MYHLQWSNSKRIVNSTVIIARFVDPHMITKCTLLLEIYELNKVQLPLRVTRTHKISETCRTNKTDLNAFLLGNMKKYGKV